MNKKVGIERCASYNPKEVYAALKQAVKHAGDLEVSGKTVLLKPNILFDSPVETAICTHPALLEASIKLVREMGAKRILVGDSPAIQGSGFSTKASGLRDVIERNDAEWVDFTAKKIDLHCPRGKAAKKFTLSHAAREADVIISLPKLKTHQLMYFTGAMKNIFGLVPSLAKSTYHVRYSNREDFASMIVDLNMAVKPAYAFMDAIIGMEGHGPAAGKPRQVGLVLASSNLLALDITAVSIIGYPPLKIPVNKDALERGLWLTSPDEIEYPGLSPADVSIPDFEKIPIKGTRSQLIDFILPRPLKKLRDSFAPMPVINHDICVRCGDCCRICASKAISIKGEGKEKYVEIAQSHCIRCFCCHEVCPVKAIDIGKRKPRKKGA